MSLQRPVQSLTFPSPGSWAVSAGAGYPVHLSLDPSTGHWLVMRPGTSGAASLLFNPLMDEMTLITKSFSLPPYLKFHCPMP